MEDISMARIRISGSNITVSGRNADKTIAKILSTPKIDFEKEINEARNVRMPEYSEKGYARLRELGKL